MGARFTVEPLFIKEEEVAKMLRHDVTWLRKNATTLESQYGFPKIDPATGMRHRESIEEWARRRNGRSDRPREEQKKENWSEF